MEWGIDGSATDAAGNVWNAQWGKSRVVRHNAEDGKIDMIVELPTVTGVGTTCACFGGPNLDTLFVTAFDGGLHAVKLPADLDVKGKLENVFGVGTPKVRSRL